MPQLSQLELVYLSQWFWLLLVLGAIYFFVGRGIVPQVEATVDERDAKIAADLAEAERLRNEADRVEEAWRTKMREAQSQAQATTAGAKATADAEIAEKVAAADADLAKKIEDAAAALDESRRGALAGIENVAAEAAREIVVKLTGADVSDSAVRSAVAGALKRA